MCALACALEPAHISYYQLTLEPGTVFHCTSAAACRTRMRRGRCRPSASKYSPRKDSSNTKFPPMRAPARAAGTISITGCSATTWAWVRARTASSASIVPDRHLADREAQAAAGLSDSHKCGRHRERSALSPIGERQHIAVADLPFEFMLNALRLNEGFAVAISSGGRALLLSGCRTGARAAPATGASSSATDRGWRPTELGRRFLNDLQAGFLAMSLCTPGSALLAQRGTYSTLRLH